MNNTKQLKDNVYIGQIDFILFMEALLHQPKCVMESSTIKAECDYLIILSVLFLIIAPNSKKISFSNKIKLRFNKHLKSRNLLSVLLRHGTRPYEWSIELTREGLLV